VGLIRRGTTCSSTVAGGRTYRPKCGQGSRRRRRGRSRSGAWVTFWCSPAVLDFLRSTYVGRAAPPVEEIETARRRWGGGGGGGDGRGGGARGVVTRGPLVYNSSLCTFLCLATISLSSPWCSTFPLSQILWGRRGGGVAATEPDLRGGTADRKRCAAIVYID